MKKRDEGPVEILCKEIGFRFDPRYERPEVLLSFVTVLVDHVEHEKVIGAAIQKAVGMEPEPGNFDEVLRQVRTMLESADKIEAAEGCHHYIHEVNPDEKMPTDHGIDMLSSCVSAVRFGLENPCRSRHAAEAANHIFRRKYGLKLHDNYSSEWQKDWARGQFQEAIFRLTETSVDASETSGNSQKGENARPKAD